MAKKTDKVMVDCKKCRYSDTVPVNCMLPCRNKERNPNGFKVGDWERFCDYYNPRT